MAEKILVGEPKKQIRQKTCQRTGGERFLDYRPREHRFFVCACAQEILFWLMEIDGQNG
jgi:hypothetical protein